MCSAAYAGAGATDVPLLREATLKVVSLEIHPEDPFCQPFPETTLRFFCSYMDQLGGPVFYRQDPLELDCTDSFGRKLNVREVSSQSGEFFQCGHADPVQIDLTLQPLSPGAEWIRIRGFFLCAFADGLEYLPSVVLPLKEDSPRREIPFKGPKPGKIELSLKKVSNAWEVKIAGKQEFYFHSLSIKCEDGFPVKEDGRGTGWSGDKRSWNKRVVVPSHAQALKVDVSYWSMFMLRKIPVDVKIGVGGFQSPVAIKTEKSS